MGPCKQLQVLDDGRLTDGQGLANRGAIWKDRAP